MWVRVVLQVVARMTQLTRPAIFLNEILNESEMERLLLLICDAELNDAAVSWGGAWAGHAITCLLLDVIEGERLSPVVESALANMADEEMSTGGSSAAEGDDVTSENDTPPTLDEESKKPCMHAHAHVYVTNPFYLYLSLFRWRSSSRETIRSQVF